METAIKSRELISSLFDSESKKNLPMTDTKSLNKLLTEIHQKSTLLLHDFPTAVQTKCLKVPFWDRADPKFDSTAISKGVEPKEPKNPWLESFDALFPKEDAAAGKVIANDAMTISNAYNKAIKLNSTVNPSLEMIDPYIMYAISDLIQITLGQTEKVAFLLRIKGLYPNPITNPDKVTPGLINLYYQLSNAKIENISEWSLKETIEELDSCLRGIEAILDNVAARQRRLTHAPNAAQPTQKLDNEDNLASIETIYQNNMFLVLARYLEVYNSRELGGEHLENYHRLKWAAARDALEVAFNANNVIKLNSPIKTEYQIATNRFDRNKWHAKDIRSDKYFDVAISMALSGLLLAESHGKADPTTCSASKYYYSTAKELEDSIKINAFDDAPEAGSKLTAFLEKIKTWIDASCS